MSQISAEFQRWWKTKVLPPKPRFWASSTSLTQSFSWFMHADPCSPFFTLPRGFWRAVPAAPCTRLGSSNKPGPWTQHCAGKPALRRARETLLHSICRFLWYEHSLHDQFQATNVSHLVWGGEEKSTLALRCWNEPAPAHHRGYQWVVNTSTYLPTPTPSPRELWGPRGRTLF